MSSDIPASDELPRADNLTGQQQAAARRAVVCQLDRDPSLTPAAAHELLVMLDILPAPTTETDQ